MEYETVEIKYRDEESKGIGIVLATDKSKLIYHHIDLAAVVTSFILPAALVKPARDK